MDLPELRWNIVNSGVMQLVAEKTLNNDASAATALIQLKASLGKILTRRPLKRHRWRYALHAVGLYPMAQDVEKRDDEPGLQFPPGTRAFRAGEASGCAESLATVAVRYSFFKYF